MRKDFLTIFIAIAILAVLQIVGGTIYTITTAVVESKYTYYDCTIVEIETEKVESDTDSEIEQYKIKNVKVSYTLADGTEIIANASYYPTPLAVGDVFVGRVSSDSTSDSVSSETTDWFTPIFMIVLGVVYALIDLLFFVFRKKTGLYALKDVSEEYVEIEDDDWTIENRSATIEDDQ